MEEQDFRLPEGLEAPDVASVISVYAPELEPQPPSLLLTWVGWIVGALFAGGLLFGPDISQRPSLLLAAFAVSVTGSWATSVGVFRWRQVQYDRLVEKHPYELHERLAAKFRAEIAEHRERLLGAETDWQKSRSELRRAAEQARSSLEYWSERWLEDPNAEAALSQRGTAQAIHAKLTNALGELDRREAALLGFFAECDRKLRILERSRSDHVESRILSDLTKHADDIVIDATLALEAIGRSFVQEATRVGRALGALQRVQLKESAGDVEAEGVERVAEKILQAAQDEERELAQLMKQVGD